MHVGQLSTTSDFVLGTPWPAVDLSVAGIQGAWVNLRGMRAIIAVLVVGPGTVGDDPVIQLEQATDATGASAKAIHIESLEYKLTSGSSFNADSDRWISPVEPNRKFPMHEFNTASIGGGENLMMLAAYVGESELDINYDFSHLRLSAPATNNTQMGSVFYIPSGRQTQGPAKFSMLEAN